MKNFYVCNILFKYIIDIYIIVLIMKTTNYENHDIFQLYIASCDWANSIKQTQRQYL